MYIQFTKDINKIKNTFFLNLTLKQFIIALITIGTAYMEVSVFKDILPISMEYYIIIPTILIGVALMFFKKNDMSFEKVIFYKVKRKLFCSKIKRYKTDIPEVKNVNNKIKKTKINKPEKAKKQSA